MKAVIGLLVAIGILVTGIVYAAGYRGQNRMENCQTVDIEKVKQFRNETTGLRDDLFIKRLELHNENMKQTPDTDKIGALRNEIREIRDKIKGVAVKYEVPLRSMKYRGRNMHKNSCWTE